MNLWTVQENNTTLVFLQLRFNFLLWLKKCLPFIDEVLSICFWAYVCEYTYIHVCMYDCFNSSLQEGTGRPVASSKATTCAELVLDVSPKTQRVILKKKVRALSVWSLEGETTSHGLTLPAGAAMLARGGTLAFFLLSCDPHSKNSKPFSSLVPFFGECIF